MGLNWIETASSVAVGAVIGTIPGVAAIMSENRRFDARAEADALRMEYEDLRDSFAVIADCYSAWAYAASKRFDESGAIDATKAVHIAQIVSHANDKYQETIGRILTNPRAEKDVPEYAAGVADWNSFMALPRGDVPERQELIDRMDKRLDDFTAAAKEELKRMARPIPLRGRRNKLRQRSAHIPDDPRTER